MIWRPGRLLGVCAAALLLVGCSSVVTGSGSAAPSGAGQSSSPDFPSSIPPLTGSATPPPSASAPASSPAVPTEDERAAALRALLRGGEDSLLVKVPAGYEAATWDQAGRIRFWFDPAASTAWRTVGRSSYPYRRALGPPAASVTGALLRRMTHATFIVTGEFSGDGSGNAVAFTTGPRGWGAIKAERNGNIGPSGRPVGRDRIGLSYGFAFADGYLVTADCPPDRPVAACGSHQIRKRWMWAGSDFRRA